MDNPTTGDEDASKATFESHDVRFKLRCVTTNGKSNLKVEPNVNLAGATATETCTRCPFQGALWFATALAGTVYRASADHLVVLKLRKQGSRPIWSAQI